jgi:phosphate starvation-inducible protein PhoH and related proteins
MAQRNNFITAKNKEQKYYARAIIENDIIIATGCPGSGKTMMACGIASEKLAKGEIQKIILTKPLVSVARDFPAVPGNVDEKTLIFRHQLEAYFCLFLGDKPYKKYKDDKVIEFIPLELMRGLNFGDEHNTCWVVGDEMQNADVKSLKCLLTRLGDNAKIILNGDTNQHDLKKLRDGDITDLQYVINKIGHLDKIATVELVQSFRNPLVDQIEKLI